jgi:hypothetical protein
VYRVDFDERAVYRDVALPGGEPWSDHFAWGDVVRVCFLTGSLFESDELYIITSTREESYVIPTEAEGGRAIVDERAPPRALFGPDDDRGGNDRGPAVLLAAGR